MSLKAPLDVARGRSARLVVLALVMLTAAIALPATASAHAPDGATDARRTLPTYLTIWASATALHPGETATISTTLNHTAGGAPIGDAAVTLWLSEDSGLTWFPSITQTTDKYGGAAASSTPRTTYLYQWRFAGNASYTAAASPIVEITVTPWATSLTMYDSHTTIYQGDTTRLVAGLTRTDDGAGLAQPISLWASGDGGSTWTPAGSTTTNASGDAWLDVSPGTTTTYQWRYAGNDELAPSSSPSTTITVIVTSATSLDISATPDRVAPGERSTIEGHLYAGSSPVGSAAVTLMSSTDDGATWTVVRTQSTDASGLVWDEVNPTVSTTYQWRYAGTRAYAPSTSPTRLVTVSAAATNIGIAADPGRVVPGDTSTIEGYLHAGDIGLTGRTLTLSASTDGGTSWTVVGTETTDATGRVSHDVTPSVSTTYRWTFAGEAAYDPSHSSDVTVTVGPPPTLTERVDRDRLGAGQRLKVTGTYSEPALATVVRLYRLTEKGGRTLIDQTRLDARGHYRFFIHPRERGLWRLRAEVVVPTITDSPVCRVHVI